MPVESDPPEKTSPPRESLLSVEESALPPQKPFDRPQVPENALFSSSSPSSHLLIFSSSLLLLFFLLFCFLLFSAS